jgi:diacylglycerol kinase family enzyme
MLTISNGPYFGMNYAVAPEQRMDDGLLTISVFSRYSKLQLWWHFASIAFGRREYSPKSIAFRVAKLRVDGPKNCLFASMAQLKRIFGRWTSRVRRTHSVFSAQT